MTAHHPPTQTNSGSRQSALWFAGLALLAFACITAPNNVNLAAQQDVDKQAAERSNANPDAGSAATIPDEQRAPRHVAVDIGAPAADAIVLRPKLRGEPLTATLIGPEDITDVRLAVAEVFGWLRPKL